MVRGRMRPPERRPGLTENAALQLSDLRGGYRRHRQTKNIGNNIMIAFTVRKTLISCFVAKKSGRTENGNLGRKGRMGRIF